MSHLERVPAHIHNKLQGQDEAGYTFTERLVVLQHAKRQDQVNWPWRCRGAGATEAKDLMHSGTMTATTKLNLNCLHDLDLFTKLWTFFPATLFSKFRLLSQNFTFVVELEIWKYIYIYILIFCRVPLLKKKQMTKSVFLPPFSPASAQKHLLFLASLLCSECSHVCFAARWDRGGESPALFAPSQPRH